MKKADKKEEVVETNDFDEETNVAAAAPLAAALARSGLYRRRVQSTPFAMREEVRIDIDGLYPQMQISGTITNGLTTRINWIARVSKVPGASEWKGDIWYKDGAMSPTSMPYTRITAKVTTPNPLTSINPTKITFFKSDGTNITYTYDYVSPYFHPVEFEFDSATGVTPITQIQTCDHPNRPGNLPCETLTIQKVFQRAGFDVKTSSGANVVPLTGAASGASAGWSDNEMHDAMQTYWSRFANRAQWSMWVFFAGLCEPTPDIPDPQRLGGVMFDDIGPNHRQGTAIFNDSFISRPEPGDPNPDAAVRRMKFWTACHEMGHSFNLAHSWQKNNAGAWIPLANDNEARSFMSYPYRVTGGEKAFYSDFLYRFSDQELLFLRHAPERFVQMGNALWFDNHGFQQAEVSPSPTFRLEVRANREKPVFEFLEPVVLELKLTNISEDPQIVEETILTVSDHLTIIIKKQGKDAKQWLPFAQYCFKSKKIVIAPGASLYESLFIAVGKNGWDVAEPGNYAIQVALGLDSEDIVSDPFYMRVLPPRGFEEESLAQDFFSEDVGRVLTFDGSRTLDAANDTLREASERFADRAVAVHAKIALGEPLTRDYKLLYLPDDGVREMASAADSNGKIQVVKAETGAADKQLSTALLEKPDESAKTLGHIDYKYYVDSFSEFVAEEGDAKQAAQAQGEMQKTLSKRGVLPSVLEEIDDRQKIYAASDKQKK